MYILNPEKVLAMTSFSSTLFSLLFLLPFQEELIHAIHPCTQSILLILLQSNQFTSLTINIHSITMPRGAEYADEPPASDNAIESGENKIAGADVRFANPPSSSLSMHLLQSNLC